MRNKNLFERQKISVQKVWSKDLVYAGTFWLSSRKPHAFKISTTYRKYFPKLKNNIIKLR